MRKSFKLFYYFYPVVKREFPEGTDEREIIAEVMRRDMIFLEEASKINASKEYGLPSQNDAEERILGFIEQFGKEGCTSSQITRRFQRIENREAILQNLANTNKISIHRETGAYKLGRITTFYKKISM